MIGRISEVFDSVQGEGLYLGQRQLFVRFFGCNLACGYCDTIMNNFMEYAPDELCREIALYEDDFHSVSFTGGEPLLQSDFLKEILRFNLQRRCNNYLETNGTLCGELEKVIDDVDIIAMDMKLPSSGKMVNVWGMHRRFLKIASRKEVFLKSVICESTKEDDLREALNIIKEVDPGAIYVLQPNYYDKGPALKQKLEDFRDICQQERVTACVIAQMHKITGLR